MYDKVIYGKDSTENIVSIEIHDGAAHLYIETESGITEKVITNKPWILSPIKYTTEMVRLQGDQFYKYGIQFPTIEEWEQFKKQNYKKNIYVVNNLKENCMINKGVTYFKGMQLSQVSVLSFDIETDGLRKHNKSTVFIISNTYRKNGVLTKKLFSKDEYSSVGEMIQAWCDWVRQMNPSIMLGHNIFSYDIPYLEHIAQLNGLSGLQLGRDGSNIKIETRESKFRVDGSRDLHYNKSSCYGRELIDTMFLAYKYDLGRKYQSYGLKPIIMYENLIKPGRQFYDASKIKDNWHIPEERAIIKQYGIDDADDALALFDLMAPPFFYMCQMIPKTFQQMIESATGSQLNSLMVRSYLQDRHSIPAASEAIQYEGAISFGEPGIYKNAVSFDIASLYPSVMLQYKVEDREKDPNGHLLYLLDYLRTSRLKYKKLAKETGSDLYKHLDTSNKALINSLYGFLGASGLNYNFPQGAADVTRHGRETLMYSIEWAKSKGYEVIKGDTDSMTFWNNDLPFEDSLIQDYLKEINGLLPEFIKFELDAVYDSIAVLKAKNYAYNEGGKIGVKGSALKASTKSEALKRFTNDIINTLVSGKSVQEIQVLCQQLYVQNIQLCNNVKNIKEWAARKTLSSTMMESERTNETKVMDAIEGSNYVEGDRFWVYYKSDDSLALVENFDGDYNRERLMKNLWDTINIFDTILPVKELFTNYTLKKNKQKLLDLLNS